MEPLFDTLAIALPNPMLIVVMIALGWAGLCLLVVALMGGAARTLKGRG